MKKELLTIVGLLSFSSIACAQDLKLSVSEKGKVGYSDTQGTIVIKQTYDAGTAFQNGYAKVMKGKQYGFIDVTGKEVLPIEYDDIQEWGNNLYIATAGKIKSLVKPDGTVVLDKKLSHISKPNVYGRAWIAMGGKVGKVGDKTIVTGCKYGIIDADGKELVTPAHKGIFEFSRKWENASSAFGECIIPNTNQMTTKDTLITDCKYLIISEDPTACKNGGLIDGNTGEEIIKQKTYSFITAPRSGMVRYYIWNKKSTDCGYFDLENKKDVRVKTFDIFVDGLSVMTHGDFTGNIAPVNTDPVINSKTWSFINKQGETVAEGFKSIKCGEAAEAWTVTDGQGTSILGFSGEKLLGGKTFEAVLLPQTKGSETIYAVKQNGKWGIIDANGNAKTEFAYDMALAPKYDWVLLGKDKKYGIVNAAGNTVMDFIADDIVLPTKEKPEYVWVKKDGLYYNYDINKKKIGSTGYKAVNNNLDNGYALVRPERMDVKQDVISRIMLGLSATTEAADTTFANRMNHFGYIVDTNDKVCFPFPMTTLYWENAMEAITRNNGKPISEGQAKKLILLWSKDQRSYPLTGTIEEDNWDY